MCSLLLVGSLVVPSVLAQTKTASPSVTLKVSPTTAKDNIDAEVDKLKEKVAQKVSDLKADKDKAVAGVVQSISGSSLTLTAPDGSKKEVTLDDTLTKYYIVQGAVLKAGKKDTVAKGDYVFAIGPEINGVVNANGVYTDTRYIAVSGKITEVNSEDFTLKIVTLDKSNYTFDIQTRTTQQMLNIKTLEAEKTGFSKFKEGDSVHVVYKANNANSKAIRFDAEKILIIPNEYFLQ